MTQTHRLFTITCAIFILFSCSKERKSNRAGYKMQEFVSELSEYAKSKKPAFLIVPQNGTELLFHNLDGEDDFNAGYLAAIDGIGMEELFYSGDFAPDNNTLPMLLRAREKKPIFVSEYVNDVELDTMAENYNRDAGFIPYIREKDNYDYHLMPPFITNENPADIRDLRDVKNYLYLTTNSSFINREAFLTNIQKTNFDLIIIDAFFNGRPFTKAEIKSLRIKQNGGKRLVLAYVSVGAAEKDRYYWQDDWKLKKPNFLSKDYSGNENKTWVKFWKNDWKGIIYGYDNSYIKKIIDIGFDGAYLDDVDAYHFLYFNE